MILVYKQIWAVLENHPEYEISNYGTVKSWKNNKYGRGTRSRILKPGRIGGNYLAFNLCSDKKRRTTKIHQLVIKYFGPPKPTPKHEPCHNDGNPQNNFSGNIRWGTRKENMADRVKHGTSNRGEKSGTSKLKEYQVLEIRELLKTGITQTEIAGRFGVSRSAIEHIKLKINWRYI